MQTDPEIPPILVFLGAPYRPKDFFTIQAQDLHQSGTIQSTSFCKPPLSMPNMSTGFSIVKRPDFGLETGGQDGI
jgi:hypothetical protein